MTVRLVWNELEARLNAEWDFASDVAFPFDEDNEFCGRPGVGGCEERGAY